MWVETDSNKTPVGYRSDGYLRTPTIHEWKAFDESRGWLTETPEHPVVLPGADQRSLYCHVCGQDVNNG